MEIFISQLTEYAVQKGWIENTDRVWAANRILEALDLNGFDGLIPRENLPDELPPIHEILEALCADAYKRGVIDGNSAAYFDLLDTKIIGALIPRPSEIIAKFKNLYQQSPQAATDWYYQFSGDTNYIRRDRIAKDQRWTTDTEYGILDISINLSKPEKDPKAIAAAGKAKSAGYPKCLLCAENEGYAGHLNHPARQNHRIIPIVLNHTNFFLQYSPYVYYNEHCIVFNQAHIPMRIDEQVFGNLLDFVTQFPHYFIGSNADLPIVGGSVLSHDHYQGGRYIFPMERAEIEKYFTIPGFEDIKTGLVKWPMSVIRLNGSDPEKIVKLGGKILSKWRGYDDPDAFIFHETDGERHNTITPIARRREDKNNNLNYELDLVLRNNITTEENPLGVFHPHAEKHHIKKENIGLIEVMGLAVLPARLEKELSAVADAILNQKDLDSNPLTASHAAWARDIQTRYPDLNADNINNILRQEVGLVFRDVLQDAGVFKRDAAGQKAFWKFIESL